MKIVSIIGARPQFIKAAPVSHHLRKAHTERLVHTGQHYDENMSAIFFRELAIPEPDYHLEIGSGAHGRQTGRMLEKIEEVLLTERPDWVLVYGDTNSTLAGALAAVKLQIPLAHVEAGLRSFNRSMPEEHNRVLTDHCADLLLCPTQSAVQQLAQEGITQGVHFVGDVMFDSALHFGALARTQSKVLTKLKLQSQQYILATIHRPYNTDEPQRLKDILQVLIECNETVILPLHPRTRHRIAEFGFENLLLAGSHLHVVEPLGYLDMLMLTQHARLILTDSGGLQKEAYFFAVPCLTLRPETEWIETVATGWNVLVDADPQKIFAVVATHPWPQTAPPQVFGDGHASHKIVQALSECQR